MQNALSRYIMLAKRWAWLLALGVVICGASTYIVTSLMHKTYVAQAELIINVTTSVSTNDNTLAAISLGTTLTPLITNPNVLQPVAQNHQMSVAALTSIITAKQQSNTEIIDLSVSGSDPQTAANIANEVASSFQKYESTQLGGNAAIVIFQASPPASPSSPKPGQDAALGAAVGLGLAIALIVMFEWIDDRLTSPEEINTLLGLEPLTIIPELSRQQKTKNAEETPELAEGCRILCASLNMSQMLRPFKMVMVTSALAGEGKSTIAANVASFLAMSGKRVLLVDADLRHPVLDQHFQLNNQQGFSNAFLEMWSQVEMGLEGQPTEIPSLRVLTAGVLPSNPSELLQSQLAFQLFNHLRNSQKFDYIIFDTPPVLPVADAQILAAYIQVSILVVDASKTPRKAIVRAKQTLARTGTRILGVAINKSHWSDFGEVHDYLGSVQQRPRADITQAMPPNMPPNMPPMNRNMEAKNTPMMQNQR